MKLTHRKKLLIYKILVAVFALVLAFMPSTVSRNSEVNSRVIVEMIGLDGEDGIEITAQYVMPTESDGATQKDVVTVNGETVIEAAEALSVALGRRAELGHCSLVVVGSDFDPQKLGSLLTSTDVTADVYVCAAKDKAGDLIKDLTEFMKKTGATDADFIAYSAKKAHIASSTLLGFLSDLNSASQTAFMPLVQMLDENGGTKDSGSEQGGGESGGEQGGGGQSGGQGGESGGGQSGGQGGEKKSEQTGMITESIVLYNMDKRVGTLEKTGARGVAWISSHVEKGVVTADVEYDGKLYSKMSARLKSKSSNIKVSPEENKATVKLKVTIDPRCEKFNALNATDGAKVKAAVQAGFEKQIKDELTEGFEKGKSMGCDPLFISREFYRYAPSYYYGGFSFDELNVEYDVTVEIK